MKSSTSRKIQKRKKPNDIFYTPIPLVKKHIEMIDNKSTDVWFDPFYGEGAYYENFPEGNHHWTEIVLKKDFFDFNTKIDIICSNPPYSIIDNILKKSIELNPRIISYLIGVNNLTTRRIEIMEKAGYGLTRIHMTKIYKWFGMSFIVVFEKDKKGILEYDRTVWRV